MSDFAICGYRPFYYPAKGISTAWNFFWDKILDIPEFPVHGSVLGEKHWELITVTNLKVNHRKIRITFHQPATSWLIPKRKDGEERPIYSDLKWNDEKTEVTFILSYDDEQTFQDIKRDLQHSNKFYLDLGETDSPAITTLHHDTSTGIVYEGPEAGNDCCLLRFKGLIIALVLPFYTVSTVAFNIIKIVPTIIYLTGHIFYAYFTQSPENKKSFLSIVWKHIKEMAFETFASIRNVVRTPFFAIGTFFGALWLIVDPKNGMKITGGFLNGWNHRKSKFEASCLICCCCYKFSFKNFFVDGLYKLAPCMDPSGIIKVDREGKRVEEAVFLVPQDIADFKWSEQKVKYQIIAEKTTKTGCCFLSQS